MCVLNINYRKIIKGLSLNKLNILMTQYTDDTNFTLDGTQKYFETSYGTQQLCKNVWHELKTMINCKAGQDRSQKEL